MFMPYSVPKARIFKNRLLTYLNKVVLFVIGTVFNFYVNEKDNNSKTLILLKLEWIYMLIFEPKRIGTIA